LFLALNRSADRAAGCLLLAVDRKIFAQLELFPVLAQSFGHNLFGAHAYVSPRTDAHSKLATMPRPWHHLALSSTRFHRLVYTGPPSHCRGACRAGGYHAGVGGGAARCRAEKKRQMRYTKYRLLGAITPVTLCGIASSIGPASAGHVAVGAAAGAATHAAAAAAHAGAAAHAAAGASAAAAAANVAMATAVVRNNAAANTTVKNAATATGATPNIAVATTVVVNNAAATTNMTNTATATTAAAAAP
jgi:hypothetical protein